MYSLHLHSFVPNSWIVKREIFLCQTSRRIASSFSQFPSQSIPPLKIGRKWSIRIIQFITRCIHRRSTCRSRHLNICNSSRTSKGESQTAVAVPCDVAVFLSLAPSNSTDYARNHMRNQNKKKILFFLRLCPWLRDVRNRKTLRIAQGPVDWELYFPLKRDSASKI